MPGTAVVFGGAGFIGSNICSELAARDWTVRAVDGLMARTFAQARRLEGLRGVSFVEQVVERPEAVAELLHGAELVVDAMGWTRHLDAAQDPLYDLRLNVASHLPLIQACARQRAALRRVVYLGSRHQYGRPSVPLIDEDCAMEPVDVQGVHKLAAERHWALFASRRTDMTVASLRFGNSYGPGQPLGDGDVGLLGGFLRAAMRNEPITVYGSGRRRNVLYVPDLARVVAGLSEVELPAGFVAFNLSGTDTTIRDLAQAAIDACGAGTLLERPIPEEVARTDVGDARLDDRRLRAVLGEIRRTPLSEGLRATVAEARRGNA